LLSGLNYYSIVCFVGDIFTKNYQNQSMCVEVTVCYISVVFVRHSVDVCIDAADDVDTGAVQTSDAVKDAELAAEVRRLRTTNGDLNASIEQLRTGNKQLSLDSERQITEIAELTKKMERQQAQLQKLSKEIEKLKTVVKTKEDEIANQNKTIMEELAKNHEQMTRKTSELATAIERVRKAEESERKLQAALADKEKETKIHCDRSTNMASGLQDKDGKIAEVEFQLQTAETRNKDLQTQLRDQEREIVQLRDTVRDKPTRSDAATNTESENAESQVSLSVEQSTLDAAYGEVDELNGQLRTLQLHEKERQLDQLCGSVDENTESRRRVDGISTILLALLYTLYVTQKLTRLNHTVTFT